MGRAGEVFVGGLPSTLLEDPSVQRLSVYNESSDPRLSNVFNLVLAFVYVRPFVVCLLCRRCLRSYFIRAAFVFFTRLFSVVAGPPLLVFFTCLG